MEIVRQPGKATRRTKYLSSARKRDRFASLVFEKLEHRVLLAVDLVSVDMTGLVAGDDLPVPSVLDPSEAGTHPDLSANGKYLVFESDAEDLRDNDGNALRDIFVRDLASGVTTLVSVTPDGVSADADSYSADISDDGRFITFVSSATNLIRGEVVDNGFPDVYLRDRDLDGNGVFDEPGELASRTFLLSRGFAEDGTPEFGNFQSGGDFPVDSALRPVISGDGSTVVFGSKASNLIDPTSGADVNVGGEDIFAVITTNVTKREVVTLNLEGRDTGVGFYGEGEAEMFAVSRDGSVIVFQSRFSDIADTEDEPLSRQIFVRSSKTERISENAVGIGGVLDSRESVISRDGRHVAFVSPSANLVEGDENSANDVFVFDRETELLTLVSRSADPLSTSVSGNAASASSGSPTIRQYSLSISDDGRFVSYSSLATDLVAAVDGTTTSDVPDTPDIFVFDRDADADGVFDEVDVPGATETILVSVNFDGTAAGDSGAPAAGSGSQRNAISGNGRFVAFASTAIDLVGEPTSGTNVFVRDLLTKTTYLASPSPDAGPFSGGELGALGQQTISISRDGSRVAFTSDSNLDPDTIDDNGARDVYVYTLPPFIEMQQFSTNSLTSLSVRYEILNAAVDDGFSIDIVRSLDETFAPASADILLATLAINEPEDLTVGIHTLTFPIGGGAGEVPLPGAGAEEPGDEKPVDYFLLAVANLVDSDEQSTLIEDTAVFFGAYHPADGPIFAHGTAGDDTITASTVDGIVTFTFSPGGGPVDVPLFPPEDVTGIRVRMHAGDDMVTGSGFGDLILGGPGSDTLFGEAGRDTMDGGPGNDRVFGGDNFDRLFDSDGDDLVDTGGPEPFGGTVNGIPGSDNIYVGAGQDTLSFDDAVLAITMDASNPNMQTVDADGNRVQATGFSYFIGTPFNDQFSIGGDVPLLFTFDGGLGSDTLTVDAKGLPTINDGKRVQVMGFEPIEYTNFDRINIINALPWVKAGLEDHLVIDKNGNGKADPGDTLEYVVTITNDGVVDARDLLFEDTLDLDMELVTGLLNISPIALDDIYVVRGPLNVNSSSGLLANDFDIDGSVPGTNADLVLDVGSVTRISDPTTSTFTAQPDGSFTYTPEPGFSGMETFTYSITDTDGMSNVGAVNLIVNDVVWFVDNSLPTNGDGSLNDPFNSLAPVNGSDGLGDMDGPGDTIFVFGGAGVYNQGFELEDNQSLIGEGHGLFLGGRDLVMPGPRPTLTNTTGDGIKLASNNTVRGLNIDGAAGANIHADGAQRGQIQDVNLSGGSIGIDLHNTGGAFTFTNVSISDPTGAVFNVEGGTSKVAFGADSTIRQSTSTGSGLHFTNANGTYSFNGGVTLDGGNAGINIMGGDVSLLLPKLSITHTGTNPVVDIRNHSRGTVNLRGLPVGGVLTLVDGQRMRFDNADGTYDFNGQVTLNGDNAGIDILGGSSGTFTFPDTDITHSGSGSAVNINDHSGGTVTFGSGSTFDATGGTGLQFSNADGVYDFNGEVTLNGGDAGIDIIGGSGTFTFTDTTITDPVGAAVNVQDHSGGTVTLGPGSSVDATGGTGLQFDNADGIYHFNGEVTLNGGDAGIDILGGSSGTFTFSDTTITDPSGAGLNVENSRPNLTFDGITVRGGTNGIRFEGVTGDFTVIGNTVIDNTTGASITVGNSRGKFRFGDTDIGQTTPVDMGIDINNSSGTFLFDDLDVQTSGTGELAARVLKGRGPGAPQWFFHGSLTGVDFEMTVADTEPLLGPSGSVRASGGFVDGSPNDAISISNGSLSIDGLTFGANQPIGGDAIHVTNAGGNNHSVEVTNSTINAPSGRGIVIDNGVPIVPSFDFGFGGLTPIAGNFDGQPGSGIGQYDSASGSWFLRNAPNTGVPDVGSFLFGPGGIPIVGDWDGDGIDTIGVYDPNTQMFNLRNTNSAGLPDISPFAFGSPGDLPVAGDWDGDGIDSMGVFRPSDGSWYLLNSSGPGQADQIIQFGIAGDIPVPGDFDGDGATDLGIFRPSNQTWYLQPSTASSSSILQFGDPNDIPISGDWNGDGVDTLAVVKPSVAGGTTSQWTLRGNNSSVGPMKVDISSNQIVSDQAGIDVLGSGAGNTIATIANNTVQSNFNSVFTHTFGAGSAVLELDVRDNRAGVYVISNEGVGNAIKLVGDLHSGQQLVDDDGGNVAARNNRLSNGVTLPITNVNGLFVNGPIDIIAGLTQLPGEGSGEGAADDRQGNDLVGGEQPEGGRLSVDLGTLPAGKSVQVVFRATINDPLDAGVTQVANQGAISGSNVDMFLTDDPNTEAPGDATITLIDGSPIQSFDFGDAPDGIMLAGVLQSYPTRLANDGARHMVVAGGPLLGSLAPDSEVDGQPNATATGDDMSGSDDEDANGTTPIVLIAGQSVSGVSFTHNGGTTGALLSAWIDVNKDGDWDDAGEQILMDFVVPPGASSTSLTELVVPATAAHGQTFVRVRISTQVELAPRGLARDGEVEDFAVSIQSEGGGVLNQQTILLNNSEEIVSQQTDLNIPGVAPSILDGVDLTDQNAIRSALIAAGVDPASIAININRRDDGQTVMTDTVVDISEEPGTVWIGDVDDPNTITVISGQLNIITTITTTTTRRFTDVLTITGELVMRRPTADLSLVVTVDNGSAAVGQNVIFTIALNNAGPDAATGVTVLDKLPAGLQFVNATTASGNYNSESGMWTVGGLPVGGTSRLTITAKLLTDQAVSNVAEVASSDQFDPDSTPGNGALAEDDQFSAGVGTCLTGGPLVAGMNRLVFSCVTPGGFAAFVVGSQLGSHYYSKWGTTVDMADPGVPAIGIGNSSGSAVVLVNLTEAQLAQPLYIQAFEMLPAHKVSNLLVAQNMPDHSGIPLLAESIGLGTSPDTLPALQAATPALKAAAIARWQAAGVSQLLADHLATIDILFSDLPNDQLAATQGNFIVLDTNAAGHGWFVDSTPNGNSEFTRDANGALLANTSSARGHIDALTVIMHELGHVLGEADQPSGSANPVMSGSLSPGLRQLPTTIAIPSIDALDVNRDGLVTPIDALLIINELNLAQGRLGRTTVDGHVLDVTGDGLLTPIDVLQVVNFLNRVSLLNRGATGLTGSGEGEDAGASTEFERVDSLLIDDVLLESLAADALNAWWKANRKR